MGELLQQSTRPLHDRRVFSRGGAFDLFSVPQRERTLDVVVEGEVVVPVRLKDVRRLVGGEVLELDDCREGAGGTGRQAVQALQHTIVRLGMAVQPCSAYVVCRHLQAVRRVCAHTVHRRQVREPTGQDMPCRSVEAQARQTQPFT
jgi:hypothetical protein